MSVSEDGGRDAEGPVLIGVQGSMTWICVDLGWDVEGPLIWLASAQGRKKNAFFM